MHGLRRVSTDMRKGRRLWMVLALSLVLLLVMASAAFAATPTTAAKAQTLKWYTVSGGSSDNLTSVLVPGHVNLNTPNGYVTMIINGVITLQPNTKYAVWVREFTGYTGPYIDLYLPLGYYALGSFTTNAYGVGHFHFNIARSQLPRATRNIQIAVNSPAGTVAATKKFAIVTN